MGARLCKKRRDDYSGDGARVNVASLSVVFNMLQCEDPPSLVIDIRKPQRYKRSHIFRAINVHIKKKEEEAEALGSPTLKGFEHRMAQDHRVVFRRRIAPSPIVIYAESNPNHTLDPRLERLASLLIEEDSNYRVYLVEGGFEAFQSQYPFYCDRQSVRESHLQNRMAYPREVVPGALYMGGIREAFSRGNLTHLGISRVISLGKTREFALYDSDMQVMTWVVGNFNDCELAPLFKSTQEFIDEAREGGHVVLVHDRYGEELAPTVILAYLVCKNGWTLEKATNFVRDKCNTRIRPSYGFWEQLGLMEQGVHKKSTLTLAVDFKKDFPGYAVP
jgi:hypothetical protein